MHIHIVELQPYTRHVVWTIYFIALHPETRAKGPLSPKPTLGSRTLEVIPKGPTHTYGGFQKSGARGPNVDPKRIRLLSSGHPQKTPNLQKRPMWYFRFLYETS